MLIEEDPNHILNQEDESLSLGSYFPKYDLTRTGGKLENVKASKLVKYFHDVVDIKVLNTLLSEWRWGKDKDDDAFEEDDSE